MAQAIRLICVGVMAFVLLCVAAAAMGQQFAAEVIGSQSPESAEWYQVRLADVAILLGIAFQTGISYRTLKEHDKQLDALTRWMTETHDEESHEQFGRVHARIDEHIRDHASGAFSLVRGNLVPKEADGGVVKRSQ